MRPARTVSSASNFLSPSTLTLLAWLYAYAYKSDFGYLGIYLSKLILLGSKGS